MTLQEYQKTKNGYKVKFYDSGIVSIISCIRSLHFNIGRSTEWIHYSMVELIGPDRPKYFEEL